MSKESQEITPKPRMPKRIRRIIVTGLVALPFIAGTLAAHYWDELHGTERIDKKIYQVIHDKNATVLTIFVKNNTASDLRRTHTPQQIQELEQVVSTIKQECSPAYEDPGFIPHFDIHFDSSEQAVNCLHHLRQVTLPDE